MQVFLVSATILPMSFLLCSASNGPDISSHGLRPRWRVGRGKQTGPAIHTPTAIKNIVVDQYRIEWLNLSTPNQNLYAKNHMVAVLVFTQPQVIDGEIYTSARVSMELGEEKKVVNLMARDGWTPGSHYFMGTYTVKLQTYATPTTRTVHFRTYPVRGGTTIGRLINKVIASKMHHFFFLPYTAEGRWKGCGDHVIHCWAFFVREGDVTSENSAEGGDTPLHKELTYTYLADGRNSHELVGRGWWVSHNPKEDPLTPETMFSDGRPTYNLKLPSNADDED